MDTKTCKLRGVRSFVEEEVARGHMVQIEFAGFSPLDRVEKKRRKEQFIGFSRRGEKRRARGG